MKSPMLPSDHQAARQRVLELGRSGNPAVLSELISVYPKDLLCLNELLLHKLGRFGFEI